MMAFAGEAEDVKEDNLRSGGILLSRKGAKRSETYLRGVKDDEIDRSATAHLLADLAAPRGECQDSNRRPSLSI